MLSIFISLIAAVVVIMVIIRHSCAVKRDPFPS